MSLLEHDSVPIDDGTASNDMFDRTFRVGVQNRFLYTPAILSVIGVPTSGIPSLDEALQLRYVPILATPAACVEYYEMGASIMFYDTVNAGRILKILQTHIANWNWLMRNRYNIERPPQEELEMIIGFCDVLVKFAGSVDNGRRGGIMAGKRQYLSNSNEKLTGNNVFNRRSLYTEDSEPTTSEKGSSLRKAFLKTRG